MGRGVKPKNFAGREINGIRYTVMTAARCQGTVIWEGVCVTCDRPVLGVPTRPRNMGGGKFGCGPCHANRKAENYSQAHLATHAGKRESYITHLTSGRPLGTLPAVLGVSRQAVYARITSPPIVRELDRAVSALTPAELLSAVMSLSATDKANVVSTAYRLRLCARAQR
jgi:transposase-like protein